MDDIDKILKNSTKADLLEALSERLPYADKVIAIVVNDKEDCGAYDIQVMHIGINHGYEALGIIQSALNNLYDEDF